MGLFDKLKSKTPAPQAELELTDETTIPKNQILSIQTFTQSRSFRGFRRVRITTYNLNGVEKNIKYFRDQRGLDFTNCAVQLMIVKADNDIGKCIRVVVDGRFMGNIYLKYQVNAEVFNAVLDKKVDKVYVKVEDSVLDEKIVGTDSYLMVHWPNMGPKASVK